MSHETLKLNRHDTFDPDEGEILVSFKYHAGCPAYGGSRFEPPINPPEPDEIEILAITTVSSTLGSPTINQVFDITALITEQEYEYIENYLYENWRADMADEDDDSDRWYRERQDRNRE